MPVEEARAELVRNAGTQFDPVIVGALLSSLDIEAGNGATPIDPAAAKMIDGSLSPSSALQSV
jgi:HD-GYP domain-containing protein (c-di-GMP phosphodiesterase class II)